MKKKIYKEKRALIVFAREPRLGKVKTRLAQTLSRPVVLELYKNFVHDVIHLASTVRCEERSIYYAGCRRAGALSLGQFHPPFDLRRQYGNDLGARMHRAFVNSYRHGFTKTMIVGTDCLSITPAQLNTAFERLNDFPCVIGPSKDGGYYLIGLRRPEQQLFTYIRWGSGVVLQQTLAAIQDLGMKAFLLPAKEDIDTVDALKRFYQAFYRRKQLCSIRFLRSFLSRTKDRSGSDMIRFQAAYKR